MVPTSRTRISIAGLALGLVSLSLGALAGCDGPPEIRSSADASASDASPLDGGLDGGGSCQTPVADDPLASARAACTFGAGRLATDTLPITEAERAALPIKHVVILMKENRSFDHVLGALNGSGQPDVEPIPASFSNVDEAGNPVSPFHLDTTCYNADPDHQWDAMHRQVNDGAMDGFVVSGARSTGTDGHFVMGHFEESDLPFYYWLSRTFAINDRHFPSARSGTWPNRNFLLLGTADGVRATYEKLPNPSTRTIFQSMDAHGVSWGVYTDDLEPFEGCLGWDSTHAGVHSFPDFLRALADGSLPSVAFVDSLGYVEDEHPPADVQLGETWTRIVYQTAAASPLWPDLALIWTYDEAGGMADHVPPPNHACVARPGIAADEPFTELGVRVPLVVISPFARPHYVSHVVQDHTSITRFIETVFGLPALTARDANADALLDMFDFGCAPALLAPPPAPPAGRDGCKSGMRTDQPTYTSRPDMSIVVSFAGSPSPRPHDRLGLYKMPRNSAESPSTTNPIPPVAWAYIGGDGQVASGAPTAGQITLDRSAAPAAQLWPPDPGIWVVYYIPAAPDGSDGYMPSDHVSIEITP